MNLKNKKCLILGGAGFLGMNLSLHLQSKGMKISVLDTLSNGYINSSDVLKANNIEFIHANALDIKNMIKILKDFDYVINLVSSNILDDGFTRQEDLVDTSILSTQILMQAATHYNVSRIIIASNLHVYGETKPYRTPCKEDMKNLKPINPLGSIKLAEETIAKTLAKAYEQKTTILRISECFGPFLKTHMPYSQMATTALACITGKECTLPNDGMDGRDYIYVKDVCEYVDKILSEDQEDMIETYYICSGKEITFREIFDLMNKHYDSEIPKIKERMVIYPFAGHIVGNNSKIKERFGDYNSNFEDSFNSTLSWLLNQFVSQQQMIQKAQESVQQTTS